MSQISINVSSLKAGHQELAINALRADPRYTHLNIKDGSWIQDQDHDYYKNKPRVTVVCNCGTEVERATSDLFSFIGCGVCKKQTRRDNKSLRKLTAKAPAAAPLDPAQLAAQLQAQIASAMAMLAKLQASAPATEPAPADDTAE